MSADGFDRTDPAVDGTGAASVRTRATSYSLTAALEDISGGVCLAGGYLHVQLATSWRICGSGGSGRDGDESEDQPPAHREGLCKLGWGMALGLSTEIRGGGQV